MGGWWSEVRGQKGCGHVKGRVVVGNVHSGRLGGVWSEKLERDKLREAIKGCGQEDWGGCSCMEEVGKGCGDGEGSS